MRNERGIALVIVMLLLISMTVLGMLSIATMTTDIQIGGNKRLKKQNMHAGESVIEVSAPFIEDAVFVGAVPANYAAIVTNTNVVTEVLGMNVPPEDTVDTATDASPDMRITSLSNVTVGGDIDYLYATTAVGNAIEYASGYEGVGTGLGQAGALIYYRINSVAQGQIGSTARLGAIYRYVTK
jgi:Tfp pilus assembly protein PilX